MRIDFETYGFDEKIASALKDAAVGDKFTLTGNATLVKIEMEKIDTRRLGGPPEFQSGDMVLTLSVVIEGLVP